jgi:hypothetical protein
LPRLTVASVAGASIQVCRVAQCRRRFVPGGDRPGDGGMGGAAAIIDRGSWIAGLGIPVGSPCSSAKGAMEM